VLWTLEALPKFDPAAGTLDAYAYRNARNRAMNALRDSVSRRDHPCERCHAGTPCGADGAHCPRYARWRERNQSKARLSRPVGLDKVSDEHESRMRAEPRAETEAEMRELHDLIDAQLPIDLREPYLKMLPGEPVPKQRRDRVRWAVADILRNPDLVPADSVQIAEDAGFEGAVGLEPDGC
jgi:hypothetical protein